MKLAIPRINEVWNSLWHNTFNNNEIITRIDTSGFHTQSLNESNISTKINLGSLYNEMIRWKYKRVNK